MASYPPRAKREEIHSKVMKRFEDYGFKTWFIPQQMWDSPKGERTVPILVSNSGDLKDKKSVIVLILTEYHQGDLGIFDYSATGDGETLEKGSALSLVEHLKEYGEDAPGLIILNPNQIYWPLDTTEDGDTPQPKNVTFTTLEELFPAGVARYKDARKLHKSPYIVKSNTSYSHHTRSAIQSLLVNEIIPKNAKLSLILHGLAENFMGTGLPWGKKSEKFHERIDKVALVEPTSEDLLFVMCEEIFKNFLRRKSRIFQKSIKQAAGTLMNEKEEEISEEKAAAMQNIGGGNLRIPRVSYGNPSDEHEMYTSRKWVLKWLIS